MTSIAAWRFRYALTSLTFAVAAVLYGLLVRLDWNYFVECDEFCGTFGDTYPWAWGLFAVASSIAWFIVRIGRGFDLVGTLITMRSGERTAYLRRMTTRGVLVACILIMITLAAQRVLRPNQGEIFPFLALIAAGIAILLGLGGSIAGIMEPLGHEKVMRPLVELGKALGRAAVPIAVVSATFILTIYSSEAWTAMRITPWYTIVLICSILIGISIVVMDTKHGAGGSAAKRRRIAGRPAARSGSPTSRSTDQRWIVPLLLGATSFVAFFVFSVDLLQPESILTAGDTTVELTHREYVSMLAKTAGLLAALTTLVACESLRDKPSGTRR